jgi:hypothetical protein
MTSIPSRRRRTAKFLGHAAFGLILIAATGLAGAALWVHLSGAALVLSETLLALATVATVALRCRSRRAGWAGLALIALVAGGWYQTIVPGNHRHWATDVAHGVTAEIDGDRVVLHNVRAFDWQDRNTAMEHWVTRHYDLAKLDTLDMFTSVWDDPDIVHLLVSFGFTDGQRVVFSVEIRREANEEFEILGGFFRKFELVLIAAEESDIVKLRTNHRGEDVRVYPVKLDHERMRKMFLTYLDFGNDLADQPAFYNTITDNCTTTVYQLATLIKPDMPLDIRLVKSGLLPEYLDEIGGLVDDVDMSERRRRAAITERAKTVPPSADFSTWIRADL